MTATNLQTISVEDRLAIQELTAPDVQERSYLSDGISGAGTQRACPGPNIPLSRGRTSIHVSPSGWLVLPRSRRRPTLVPLHHRTQGPFTGPMIGS